MLALCEIITAVFTYVKNECDPFVILRSGWGIRKNNKLLNIGTNLDQEWDSDENGKDEHAT